MSGDALAQLREATTAFNSVQERATNAAAALERHNDATVDQANRLKELDQQDADYRTALALDNANSCTPPDAGERDELRADLAVAERIREELSLRYNRAKDAEATAKKRYDQAFAAAVKQRFLEPELVRFAQAFDIVRDRGVKVIAAHRLAFKDQTDHLPSLTHWYGPVAVLFEALHASNGWYEHPYSVRPDWLPRYGSLIQPYKLQGVAETEQQILDTLRKESE